MQQLTDALLAIEEERAIWSTTEKASVETIEKKSNSFKAEIAVLTDTLSKVMVKFFFIFITAIYDRL